MKWFNGQSFVDMPDPDPSLIPDGFSPPSEAAGPSAVTETVRNWGAGQGQNIVHAPHTFIRKRVAVAITETSTASPLLSAVTRIDLSGQLVNYLLFAPSATGKDIFCSLGGDIEWITVGGIAYPVGDFVVGGDQNSVLMPIPARDNWMIECVCWSNPIGITTDLYSVGYGYQPFYRGGGDRWPDG